MEALIDMAASTILLLILYAVAIAAVAWYVYQNRQKLQCLHCMMVGMVFGGVTGLVVGTLYALETGSFVWSMIAGSVAGLVVGVPLGLLGGHMGRMEALMAAPMGGFMGGMLGMMVRPYDVNLFISFFTAVIGVMMAEMGYVVFKTVNERRAAFFETAFACAMIGAVVLATSFTGFSPATEASGLAFLAGQEAPSTATAQVVAAAPSIEPNAQAPQQQPQALASEATIRLERFGYDPDEITLPAGVPIKLKLEAASGAGCTRAFNIPKLGLKVTVPAGGSEVLELAAQPPGRLEFTCDMRMAKGVMVFA